MSDASDPRSGFDGGLDGELVALFESPDQRACRELALVLRAKNVPFVLSRAGPSFSLLVAAEDLAYARHQLELYERENAAWPPREELPPAAPGYLQGVVAYVAALALVFVLSSDGAFGRDWMAAGRIDGAAVRAGEVWRAATALSLHAGFLHLLSNLVFGALFGFLLAYVHGGGLAWLLVLVAGVLGNLTNVLLQAPGHLSVGASTAVFGAVGLLAGSEWRRRTLLRHGRLRRMAPFLGGLILLAYLGMGQGLGDRHTDVVAHVTGLVWGLPLGALLASLPERLHRSRGAQAAAGALAAALLVAAWVAALR